MEGDRAVSTIGSSSLVMTGARRAPRSQPAPLDAARVRVVIADAAGRERVVGSGADALQRRDLTAAERAAVRATIDAVALLRTRFGRAGFDDAGHAVTLVLRSSDADQRGPYAMDGVITAGSRNPMAEGGMRGRGDRILPLDVAIHELMHVVQFAELGSDGARLHPALAEGVADAMAMLVTRDWSIGEGYFRRPGEVARETIRQVGPAADGVAKLGEPVVTDYRQVRAGRVEEHAAGAVISRTFHELQRRVGWQRAEDLLWAVVTDRSAWKGGGSWRQITQSMLRQSARLWGSDAALQAAVGAAMRATNLHEALAEDLRRRSNSR
jgi:hypothetical protein